jgi:hypothetical protein
VPFNPEKIGIVPCILTVSCSLENAATVHVDNNSCLLVYNSSDHKHFQFDSSEDYIAVSSLGLIYIIDKLAGCKYRETYMEFIKSETKLF